MLRARKPEAVVKRLKLFMFGPAGVGKTTAAIQFPNSYIIDCERGCENYEKLINASNSVVYQTTDIHDVIGTPDCSFIKIIDEQTANWSRDEAQNLMANWLTSGQQWDAVISNNDEMAIGALQAMKAAGIDTSKVIIGGVDATQDALASMKAGDLKATVFQDAAGQGKGSLDAALKLAKGEAVDQKVYIPFQLVTPENMDQFMTKN